MTDWLTDRSTVSYWVLYSEDTLLTANRHTVPEGTVHWVRTGESLWLCCFILRWCLLMGLRQGDRMGQLQLHPFLFPCHYMQSTRTQVVNCFIRFCWTKNPSWVHDHHKFYNSEYTYMIFQTQQFPNCGLVEKCVHFVNQSCAKCLEYTHYIYLYIYVYVLVIHFFMMWR